MDYDESLEHDGPCGVAQSVLQGSEYLCDARISRMSCNKDMLDIFGLGCGELIKTLAHGLRVLQKAFMP